MNRLRDHLGLTYVSVSNGRHVLGSTVEGHEMSTASQRQLTMSVSRQPIVTVAKVELFILFLVYANTKLSFFFFFFVNMDPALCLSGHVTALLLSVA
jgi:hypothetical protein